MCAPQWAAVASQHESPGVAERLLRMNIRPGRSAVNPGSFSRVMTHCQFRRCSEKCALSCLLQVLQMWCYSWDVSPSCCASLLLEDRSLLYGSALQLLRPAEEIHAMLSYT